MSKKGQGNNMSENRYCLQMVACDGGCGNDSTSGGGMGTENVYSTEETVCGTWIDGKPIYRKVLSGHLEINSGNACVFTDVSDLFIERLINLYGNMIDNQGVGHITMQTSYNSAQGINASVNMFYKSTTKKIHYHFLNCGGAYSGCTAYVVLEYTKKTDGAS